jgi:hypothetical protein
MKGYPIIYGLMLIALAAVAIFGCGKDEPIAPADTEWQAYESPVVYGEGSTKRTDWGTVTLYEPTNTFEAEGDSVCYRYKIEIDDLEDIDDYWRFRLKMTWNKDKYNLQSNYFGDGAGITGDYMAEEAYTDGLYPDYAADNMPVTSDTLRTYLFVYECCMTYDYPSLLCYFDIIGHEFEPSSPNVEWVDAYTFTDRGAWETLKMEDDTYRAPPED